MHRRALPLLFGSLVLAPPRRLLAQEFPARAVRLICPFAAGGPSDVVARALAQSLGELWRQPVVVENRAGAGGTIGADAVAKASPDGHALLLMNPGGLSIVQTLYGNLPFDLMHDLAPVTMVAVSPYVIAVHPGLPARSLQELIQLSRTRAGGLNFGSGGNGTVPHIASVAFQEMTGARWEHSPYRGDAAILPDLLAGRIDVTIISVLAALPHLRSGALRGLAVTTATRSSFVPDLPTAKEAGLPDFEYAAFQAIWTTGGTPPPVIAKLQADIVSALQTPPVQDRLGSQGAEPHWTSPDAFAAWMRAETERYARIIRTAGIKPN
jgi:tripartite-type tricarboxylate transporter receptor subunit TctC